MMKILITMNLMSSYMFIFMNHPLSMGVTLLIQTILISMITSLMNSSSWFSYMLFLIMVGGMLILFMYMTSIASNEKFKPLNMMILMTMPAMLLFTNKDFKMFYNSLTMEMNSLIKDNSIYLSMNKYTSFPTTMMFAFLMMYLLITLIATVKMSNSKKGPLRTMN